MNRGSAAVHVLHVDDDPAFVDMSAKLLEREADRYTVATATSAAGGLEYLSDHDVDCIISDYDMPRTDGLDFLAAVRESYPDLPFILFTGKGSEEVASDAIAGGATDYLQKGTGAERYELLANRLDNAVEQYRARRERQQVYQALETATQGIGILDADGCYVYLNDAYAAQYGYDPEELIGSHWERLYPDLEVQRFTDDILPTLSEKGEWSGRSQGLHADGSTFPEQLSLTRLDSGGHVCVVQDISEQVARERDLVETSQQLQAVLQTVDASIFIKDADGRYQLMNQECRKVLGVGADKDVTGLTDHDVLPADVAERIQADDRRVMDRGETLEIEETVPTPDGPRTHLTLKSPLLEDGEVVGICAVSTDITERKEQDRELELKRQAMDEAPVGITLTDAQRDDNPLMYANDEFIELVGYDREEILDHNHRILQGPETREEPVAELRAAIDAGDPATVELRNYSSDGTMFWNRVSIAPIRDEAGTITNWVGFQEEITERKANERQLRAERDRLQALFDLVPEPLTYVHFEDGEPIIQDVNEAFEETFGYEASTVVGESGNEVLVPPADRSMAERLDERVRKDGTIKQEVRRQTADGKRDFLFRSVPVGDQRETNRYFGLYIDVGEQMAEQRRLQRENEQFDTLASAVSHDLQTPLETARGNLELAMESDDNTQEYLGKAQTALERVDDLRQDFVDVLRARTVVDSPEPTEVESLATDAWAAIDGSESASLDVADSPRIVADSGALRRAFENLFVNALTHGDADTVRVGSVADGIYIADDGEGIPPEQREDVFELGVSTTSDGSGVGLASVEQIVSAHGWRIAVVESDIGGARFEIRGIELAE